jgi:outer membrane biosynthesis protein TonB
LDRYNAVNYKKSRTQLVASWIKAREDAILAEQRKKQNAKRAELARAQNAKEKANQTSKANIATTKKPVKTKTYQPPKNIAKKKVISKKKKIASISSSKSKSKKIIKAENKYYLDLYRWELIREIRNAVVYPEWAKKFGQKGEVILNFNVSRNAEVSDVKGDNTDLSVLLVSELHRVILAVTPFILPPDALPGKSWPVTIGYKFNPNSDKQDFIKKPNKPKSLNSSKKVSRADYNQALSKYIDDVKDMITDKIEYPVWAKKLNQKGNVIIEVTINKDGSMAHMTDKELSRHETLNQEVRGAIEESLPLPAIPSRLKLNSTTFIIERNFK